MLGYDFITYIQKWQLPNYVSVEDSADKFNFLFTPVLLILSTVIISTKQYVFKPLSCFCSTHLTGSGAHDFVENYCWVTGTYALAPEAKIPVEEKEWKLLESKMIYYYQWVPFILGVQCVLFYVPRVIWLAVVTGKIGSDTQSMVTEASKASSLSDKDQRQKMVRHLAASVHHIQAVHRDYRQGVWAHRRQTLLRYCGLCLPSKRLGTSLVCWYLLVKLMYVANAFGQLWLMSHFLSHGSGSNSTFIGWRALADALSGRDWRATQLFPRVTFCRVPLRATEPRTYSCQCALPVNMLNEKVYLLLWFWVMFGALYTLVSLLVWVARLGIKRNRLRFVCRLLKVNEVKEAKSNPAMLKKFVDKLLKHDFVFIFKMMQLNAGDVVTGEVIKELWQIWGKEEEEKEAKRAKEMDQEVDKFDGQKLNLV